MTSYLENAAGTYLLACDRIEALQRRIETWPKIEEFMDLAVEDLRLAGENLPWAMLWDVIENAPFESDETFGIVVSGPLPLVTSLAKTQVI